MRSSGQHDKEMSIGSVDLGSIPRIAVPLDDVDLDGKLAAADQWADLVELRVDLCTNRDPAHVAATCRRIRDHGAPLLVTVRCRRQGGAASLGNDERLALYRATAADADAFDVEIESPIFEAVLALAGEHGLTTIASHHDFESTPADSELGRLVERARSAGADIVKLAATANSADDRNRLLDLLRDCRDQPMIVIAMGAHGAASRVFFPLCGSLITYGFVGEAVAPGQLSIEELKRELEKYSPEMRIA